MAELVLFLSDVGQPTQDLNGNDTHSKQKTNPEHLADDRSTTTADLVNIRHAQNLFFLIVSVVFDVRCVPGPDPKNPPMHLLRNAAYRLMREIC